MQLTLKNGTKRSMHYSIIPDLIVSLLTKQKALHIAQSVTEETARALYGKFIAMRADFNSGVILESSYRDALNIIKSYFEQTPKPYPESLHTQEILQEFKKLKIVIG